MPEQSQSRLYKSRKIQSKEHIRNTPYFYNHKMQQAACCTVNLINNHDSKKQHGSSCQDNRFIRKRKLPIKTQQSKCNYFISGVDSEEISHISCIKKGICKSAVRNVWNRAAYIPLWIKPLSNSKEVENRTMKGRGNRK